VLFLSLETLRTRKRSNAAPTKTGSRKQRKHISTAYANGSVKMINGIVKISRSLQKKTPSNREFQSGAAIGGIVPGTYRLIDILLNMQRWWDGRIRRVQVAREDPINQSRLLVQARRIKRMLSALRAHRLIRGALPQWLQRIRSSERLPGS
jgi:hypothetical protein